MTGTVPAPALDPALWPEEAQKPTIVLHLPLPPSVNKLWAQSGRKRVRSGEYTAWLREAGWTIRTQLVGATEILGLFNAAIEVPASSRRDLDSWTKPIFDICQHAGAIRNDSGLRKYEVRSTDRQDVMVALYDMGGPEQRRPNPLRLARHTMPSSASRKRIMRGAANYARYLP